MLKSNQALMIAGPVGALETLYLPAHGHGKGVAVINHPNPTQGGTHTNKVVQTAAKSLSKLGYHCYLPNLRGVGHSEGHHDYGVGEVDDVLAVMAHAQAQHPEARRLTLAGFSFGGYVSTFVAHHVALDHLLLLAPAVGKYPQPAPAVPHPERTLVIHGEVDEVIPLSAASAWCHPQALPLLLVPQAGHFFHGRLIELGRLIERYLEV